MWFSKEEEQSLMVVEQVSGIALEHELYPEKSNHDNLVTQLHVVNCSGSSRKSHSCSVVYALLIFLYQGEAFSWFLFILLHTRKCDWAMFKLFLYCTHILIQTKQSSCKQLQASLKTFPNHLEVTLHLQYFRYIFSYSIFASPKETWCRIQTSKNYRKNV